MVKGRYGMQAIKLVNIAMMKCDRKLNLEENGLYMLQISRAGEDNWIGEPIVAQAIHKAMCYIHHRDSQHWPLVNLSS